MKRYNLIPLALAAYLGLMAWLGYPHWVVGEYSSLRYFGIIALSLVLIYLVRLNLLKRDRRRRQTRDDAADQSNSTK